MSSPGGDGEAGGSLSAGTNRLRETTKWLIAGYAAVASVLVAGAQLTSIGDLRFGEPRFWIAVVGLALALMAVIAGMLVAARTMTSSHLDLVTLVTMPTAKPKLWRHKRRRDWRVRTAADHTVALYRPDLTANTGGSGSSDPTSPRIPGETGVAALKTTLEEHYRRYIAFRRSLIRLRERISGAKLAAIAAGTPIDFSRPEFLDSIELPKLDPPSDGGGAPPAPADAEAPAPADAEAQAAVAVQPTDDAGQAQPAQPGQAGSGAQVYKAARAVYVNLEREIGRAQELVATVLATASFEQMRLTFRRALWVLGGLALVASAGIAMFVWAAQPREELAPVLPPRAATVAVPAAVQEEMRERLGDACPLLGLRAEVLAESEDTLLVLARDEACESEAFTVPASAELDEEEDEEEEASGSQQGQDEQDDQAS